MTARILLIDDEQSILDILKYNLEQEGYEVHVATDGREGLHLCATLQPDLVVLDIMLPHRNGLEICQELRHDPATSHIRIMMVSARSDEVDEIVGFNMGADEYIAKPFKLKPLLHRIKALLRRPETEIPPTHEIKVGDIVVDMIRFTASRGSENLHLTPTELQILWLLMSSPGRAYSRLDLLEAARGADTPSTERTIDVHIKSLRTKLDKQGSWIQTVRGVGYRFSAAE